MAAVAESHKSLQIEERNLLSFIIYSITLLSLTFTIASLLHSTKLHRISTTQVFYTQNYCFC